MLKNSICVALMMLVAGTLFTQVQHESIVRKSDLRPLGMDRHLANYNIYALDLAQLLTDIKAADGIFNLILDLEGERFDLSIVEHDIRHPDYQLQVLTDTGLQILDRPPNTTFRGWNNATDDGDIRLTITKEYLAGVITSKEGEELFIQPLGDFVHADSDQLVVYREADVMTNVPIACGANAAHHAPLGLPSPESSSKGRSIACMEAEVAIAADYSMYQKFGSSVNSVANHLLTIKNMMEANYAVFQVEFAVITNFIVSSSNGDPWTSSTDSRTLLESFSCWGGSGSSGFLGCSGSNGFGTSFDVAELWSDRNFDGTTIGRAWLNSICSNFFRYSVNEHFSSNNQALRALIAHEVGHNFGADHDSGGGWIMSTPLSSSYVDFSSTSQNVINSALPNFSCLSDCSSALPVELSDFSADLVQDRVQIEWETQSEIAFDHFEIEHGADGIEFGLLAIKHGYGTESSVARYNHVHFNPFEGDNYYRLKMIDQDGTVSYSEVEAVPYLRSDLVIYPNPATEIISVSQSTLSDQRYDILSMTGSVMLSGVLPASETTTLPLYGFSPGVYLLKIHRKGRAIVTRFTVQ